VDIPLDTDIALFVDPYALTVAGDDDLRNCGDVVVEYFELLLAAIKDKDEKTAFELLSNLHEPNDTHLGLSTGKPQGRGWGYKQSRQLYDRFVKSKAVKSGKIKDITDVELLIPGIGSDKISDMTTNIIRGYLISYTEEQCSLHGIPTEEVNAGKYWNPEENLWSSRYAKLPVYQDSRIVLVPKAAVRVRLIPDNQEYYNKFILQYLQAEHLNANSSLVRTLKNGKREVYKKDLKKVQKGGKNALFEFSEKHPNVLDDYKKSLREKGMPISDIAIENKQGDRRPVMDASLPKQLKQIAPGDAHASEYHNTILKALQSILYPWLTQPKKEQEINDGRKRIDILFNNAASDGFFSRLVNFHKVFAPYVSIECKNYSSDPKNPEFDQLLGRFSRKRGHFGMMFCRTIKDRDTMIARCKDVVNDKDGAVILVFDDDDVLKMFDLKQEFDDKGISEFLDAKIKEVLM
jgi:hypothetical protein